jgi:hypothetical protein
LKVPEQERDAFIRCIAHVVKAVDSRMERSSDGVLEIPNEREVERTSILAEVEGGSSLMRRPREKWESHFFLVHGLAEWVRQSAFPESSAPYPGLSSPQARLLASQFAELYLRQAELLGISTANLTSVNRQDLDLELLTGSARERFVSDPAAAKKSNDSHPMTRKESLTEKIVQQSAPLPGWANACLRGFKGSLNKLSLNEAETGHIKLWGGDELTVIVKRLSARNGGRVYISIDNLSKGKGIECTVSEATFNKLQGAVTLDAITHTARHIHPV